MWLIWESAMQEDLLNMKGEEKEHTFNTYSLLVSLVEPPAGESYPSGSCCPTRAARGLIEPRS